MAKRNRTVGPQKRQMPSQNFREVQRVKAKIALIERIPSQIREIEMTFTNGNRYTLKEDNVRVNWLEFREMWEHAEKGSKVLLLVTKASRIEGVTYCYE